jgi:hypothetical protein
MNILKLILGVALYSFALLSPKTLTAETAIQQAVASTWTDAERASTLTIISDQYKVSDHLEEYNNVWLVTLLIGAAITNMVVAIATATANSENDKFKPYKPWFLWGASVLSIVAGLLVSLPKMTNLEGEKQFYHTKSSRLLVLQNQIQLNLISKEAANKSLQEILELKPNK